MQFQLNTKERQQLTTLSRREKDSRALRRVQALLWLDAGTAVQEVAKRLSVSRQVIYHWVARFEDRQDLTLEARIHDGLRPGRPRSVHGVIDPLIEEVMNQEPRDWGYPGVEWTSGTLARYLAEVHDIAVSRRSVSFALVRLRPKGGLERRRNVRPQ